MKYQQNRLNTLRAAIAAITAISASTAVMATEPCGDFGECKALVEINASDGDIGFHFLLDGDDLNAAMIHDPDGNLVFEDAAAGPLLEQKLTEIFAESAEPLCFDPLDDDDPENDDEDFVTLEEFLGRWTPGVYFYTGIGDDDEISEGETELKFEFPAAPTDLEFEDGVISWSAGDDLGECASNAELAALVRGVLPAHPEDVVVDAWEIVLEPDVEDGDPLGQMKFTIRVPGDISPMSVTVPEDYLASLPGNTPAKIEVGAIGAEDNATFTEEGDICLNEDEGRHPSTSVHNVIGAGWGGDEGGCGGDDE
jgi:hypothetical protein